MGRQKLVGRSVWVIMGPDTSSCGVLGGIMGQKIFVQSESPLSGITRIFFIGAELRFDRY